MAINLKSEADKALLALNQGRANSAFKTARGVLRKAPNEPFFNNLAGLALCAMDRHRDSLPYFQKAMRANPGFIEAQKNLVQTLVLLGEHDRAQTQLRRLIEQRPRDAELAYMLALSFSQSGALPEAEAEINRAIDLHPDMAKAYNLRGIVRRGLCRLRDSIADFHHALKLQPDMPEVIGNLANSLSIHSQGEEAMQALKRGLEIAPDNVNLLHRYAGLNGDMGRPDVAADAFGRILALEPDHPVALANRARLADKADAAGMIPRLKSAYAALDARAPGRVDLGFSLWTLLRKQGEVEEAETWLRRANDLAAKLQPPDRAEGQQELERIRRFFPLQQPVAQNGEDSGPRPIFVLGLIRSGTTLTEQILAAAPSVQGLGELGLARVLAERYYARDQGFSAQDAAGFARDFRAELPDFPPGTRAFVDKMPGNFLRVGFLLAAFPDCRIINLVRDPRDTALSAYSNHLPDARLAFCTDLPAMAEYFNRYREVMQHWHALFPGRILDWSYEEMVRDIAAASHRLAEFCDIDWTGAMATPERNSSAVLTASALQVRQPVHTRSIGGWQRHAGLLAPFIERLDPALWPEVVA